MALRSDAALAVTAGRSSLRRVAYRVMFTDGVVVAWAVVGAQLLRFGQSATLSSDATPSTSALELDYGWVSVGVVLLWLFMLRIHGSYDTRMFGHGTQEYAAVTRATFQLFAGLAIISYLAKLELARGYVLVAFPAGLIGLLVARRVWRTWLGAHRARGDYADRVLVVGDLDHVRSLVRDLRAASDAGFAVVAACCDDAREVDGVPVVDTETGAADAAVRLGVDVVACAASWRRGAPGLRRLGWALEGSGIDLVVSPGLVDVAGPRIRSRPVAGLPLLYVEGPTFSGPTRLAKAAIDRSVSAALLLFLVPVFLVVGVAVRVSDPGPVFYSQSRIGLGGRRFVMYKFRSMRVGADQIKLEANDAQGPLFKLRDDPRVTRVGKLIRRFSIDELPQLWNILRGDMSLVGPRPPLASEVAEYADDVHRRLLVKPGLTGLWQVSGRSDLSWEDSVRLDLYYVENWSFTTDLRILLRTLRAVIERRGAY